MAVIHGKTYQVEPHPPKHEILEQTKSAVFFGEDPKMDGHPECIFKKHPETKRFVLIFG